MKKTLVTVTAVALTAVALAATSYSPTYNQIERLITAVNKGNGGGGSGGGGGGSGETAAIVRADDATVTTNTAHGALYTDRISLYGASSANVGDMPRMGANGGLEWGPGAGSFAVEGDADGTLTTAVCTNRIRFVSDPNSNVRFTVTPLADGTVEIKVGVFYR